VIRSKLVSGYRYTDGKVHAVSDKSNPALDQDLPEFQYPIRIRGYEIGVLKARKPDKSSEWSQDEIELIETVVSNLDIAIESARLYQDTRRRAAQEQITREITEKMRRATSVEGIIQTAVNELHQALGTNRRVYAELDIAAQPKEQQIQNSAVNTAEDEQE
jgi:GAF domain-containing protein